MPEIDERAGDNLRAGAAAVRRWSKPNVRGGWRRRNSTSGRREGRAAAADGERGIGLRDRGPESPSSVVSGLIDLGQTRLQTQQ